MFRRWSSFSVRTHARSESSTYSASLSGSCWTLGFFTRASFARCPKPLGCRRGSGENLDRQALQGLCDRGRPRHLAKVDTQADVEELDSGRTAVGVVVDVPRVV